MAGPLAYFLTWTCYGTWLHGDPRGAVDDEHNVYETPRLPPSIERFRFVTRAMKHPAMALTPAMRMLVAETIDAHCRIRAWPLLALNVRKTHAHAVVAAREADPGSVEGQFKAWATRRLREAKLSPPDRPVWTARGSTIYLWDGISVARCVRYTLHEQGENLPGTTRELVRGPAGEPGVERERG